MDSEQLKYISYLTQTTSLTKVAEHFFTSHQVVKKAIANLEEELHVTLIQTTNQGSRLTPAGLCVAEHAPKFQQQYLELTEALQNFRPSQPDKITELHLYVVPSMANDYYLTLYDTFFEQHTQSKLVLHVSTFPQMLKDAASAENRVYLSMISSSQDMTFELNAFAQKYQLRSILFEPITTYICMHKSSPYTKLAHPSLADLKEASIYVFLNTNPLCFSEEDPGPSIQYFSDYSILKRNIKKQQALGIVKKADYEYYFGKDNSEFILRPLNETKMQYTILVSENTLTENPLIQEFIYFLQKHLQE